ncbi:Uncharacterised protein [Candidatus Tiddalikarchaeum anstoanum]|nr:Uncharacterised protein [Candidatus Tiddalikarchaeum anstoanum]
MEIQCIRCKGRGFCGKTCKWQSEAFKSIEFKKDFTGTSPSVFIGHYNYPNVYVGIMSLQFQTPLAKTYDDPKLWSKSYNISQVVDKRRNLVNNKSASCVKKLSDSFIGKVQEVALSYKPLDIEVSLKKAPTPSLKYDFISNPMGPSSEVAKLTVCDNPRIKPVVEKCFNDTDLKSTKAMGLLYNKGFDENTISHILSSGALGVKKERKLVPTRWSITAVDDGVGKQLIANVKNYPLIDHYEILNGSLYGNYYTIILLPDVFGYELFETTNGNEYCRDVEMYKGRSDYAYNTAGGYYAARLGVLEYLNKIKKQAAVIVLRQITSEYYCPIGVWVVRQASRNAASNVKQFNSENELLNYLPIITPIHFLLKDSKLYNHFKTQKKITSFII